MNAPTATAWIASVGEQLDEFAAAGRAEELADARAALEAHYDRAPDEMPRTSAEWAGYQVIGERLWQEVKRLEGLV